MRSPHRVPPARIRRPKPRIFLFVLPVIAAAALSGCGGSENGGDGSSSRPRQPELDAAAVIARLKKAYHEAKSYRDEAVVRVQGAPGNGKTADEAPQAVAFERPGKLRFTNEIAEVASDGETLRARLHAPLLGDYGGQVLLRNVPPELGLADLAADPTLAAAIEEGIAGPPIPLHLLLTDDPLPKLFGTPSKKRLLAEEKIGDRPCYRVELTVRKDKTVLWIDRQSFLLRRAELVREDATADDDAKAPDYHVTVEYRQARFGGEIDESLFQLEVPAGAPQVSYFVPPPLPLESESLGRSPGDFRFRPLEGDDPVTGGSLEGKIAVLLWVDAAPPSRDALRQLDGVRSAQTAGEDAAFYAISVAPAAVTDEELTSRLAEWNVSVPLLRDEEAHGKSLFGVEVAPTLVILGREGEMQVFQAGYEEGLERTLPVRIQALEEGNDLASARRETQRVALEGYRQQLAAAGAVGPSTLLEIPEIDIAEESPPQTLKLTQLWECRELTAPGNLLVVEEESGPSIYALDGYRTVARLDSAGKVRQRFELDLPDGAAVTTLRTAVAETGRHFLAGARPGPQVFLFDGEFQRRLLSYPDAASESYQLHDFELLDLNDDGELELYAGLWNGHGLHAIKADGTPLWRDRRAVPSVHSLAITRPNEAGFRYLPATGESGEIVVFNQYGKSDPPVRVQARPIHMLVSARFAGGSTAYCGVSHTLAGEDHAVALDESFREIWSYPVPAAPHGVQIEWITSGRLLGDSGGQWVLAFPDGSLRFLSDGVAGDELEFFDYYFSGRLLTGVAVAQFDGQGVLLLSSPQGISAYAVSR